MGFCTAGASSSTNVLFRWPSLVSILNTCRRDSSSCIAFAITAFSSCVLMLSMIFLNVFWLLTDRAPLPIRFQNHCKFTTIPPHHQHPTFFCRPIRRIRRKLVTPFVEKRANSSKEIPRLNKTTPFLRRNNKRDGVSELLNESFSSSSVFLFSVSFGFAEAISHLNLYGVSE